jgi:hypothetical protein
LYAKLQENGKGNKYEPTSEGVEYLCKLSALVEAWIEVAAKTDNFYYSLTQYIFNNKSNIISVEIVRLIHKSMNNIFSLLRSNPIKNLIGQVKKAQ